MRELIFSETTLVSGGADIIGAGLGGPGGAIVGSAVSAGIVYYGGDAAGSWISSGVDAVDSYFSGSDSSSSGS